MNILAIDTATEYLSLGLHTPGKRSFILEKIGAKHTEFALDKITGLLDEHGVLASDLNLIAYNQGPGSFTGLRIGLSLAMGLALGLEIKLMPIPAFAIHAHHLKQTSSAHDAHRSNLPQQLLIGLDARLKEIYLAGINLSTWEYFIEPQIVTPGSLQYVEDVTLIGNGFTNYYDLFNPKWQNVIKATDFTLDDYPNALNMLDLALSGKYPKIDVVDADLLYLRDKIALNIEEQNKLRATSCTK